MRQRGTTGIQSDEPGASPQSGAASGPETIVPGATRP